MDSWCSRMGPQNLKPLVRGGFGDGSMRELWWALWCSGVVAFDAILTAINKMVIWWMSMAVLG